MKRKVEAVAYHRNGISGAPFYVVTFVNDDGRKLVGVVFDYDEDTHRRPIPIPKVAVFDRELLGAGEIAFGVNSFRGDNFALFLYAAIREYEKERAAC